MKRNNDRMLLESLVRKYGKNGVKNAIRRINEDEQFNNSDFEINSYGILIEYYGKDKHVIIPRGVTRIGNSAFTGNRYITSVVIPDGVEHIYMTAFMGCENLKSVTIPNSMKTISGIAFKDCKNLTKINIPNNTYVADSAFMGCEKLIIDGFDTSSPDLSKYHSNRQIKTKTKNYNTSDVLFFAALFADYRDEYPYDSEECLPIDKIKKIGSKTVAYATLDENEYDGTPRDAMKSVLCHLYTESGESNIDEVRMKFYFTETDEEKWIKVKFDVNPFEDLADYEE